MSTQQSLTGLPRSTTREQWRIAYRWSRSVMRELTEAATDCMIFGTGAFELTADTFPLVPVRHVPIETLCFQRGKP